MAAASRLRGFGKSQPGGWTYNILPYMELATVHDMGLNDGPFLSGDDGPAGSRARQASALAGILLPQPPPAMAYPSPLVWNKTFQIYNIAVTRQPKITGRTDYAASGGDTANSRPIISIRCRFGTATPDTDKPVAELWTGAYTTGVVYRHHSVKMADIKDGASNTFMVGEKYLNPDKYTDQPGPFRQYAMGQGLGLRHVPLERLPGPI